MCYTVDADSTAAVTIPYEEKAEKPKAKTEDKPARKKAATPRNKSRKTANK